DPPTVSSQAVLSEAIGTLLAEDQLSQDDWSLSDEELLDRMLHFEKTKDAIKREYLGRLPVQVLCLQLSGTLESTGLMNRANAKRAIEEGLAREYPDEQWLGYVFSDHGAFSKSLVFVDPDNGFEWSVGEH